MTPIPPAYKTVLDTYHDLHTRIGRGSVCVASVVSGAWRKPPFKGTTRPGLQVETLIHNLVKYGILSHEPTNGDRLGQHVNLFKTNHTLWQHYT